MDLSSEQVWASGGSGCLVVGEVFRSSFVSPGGQAIHKADRAGVAAGVGGGRDDRILGVYFQLQLSVATDDGQDLTSLGRYLFR